MSLAVVGAFSSADPTGRIVARRCSIPGAGCLRIHPLVHRNVLWSDVAPHDTMRSHLASRHVRELSCRVVCAGGVGAMQRGGARIIFRRATAGSHRCEYTAQIAQINREILRLGNVHLHGRSCRLTCEHAHLYTSVGARIDIRCPFAQACVSTERSFEQSAGTPTVHTHTHTRPHSFHTPIGMACFRKAVCAALLAGGLTQALVAPVGPKQPAHALRKPKVALQQVDIGSLIADSQRQLARAEARHRRAIARARKGLSTLLVSSGRAMGATVGRHAAALEASASSLKAAAALARRVADDESVPASAGAKPAQKHEGWGGADMELRAKLRAKADMADHEAAKFSRSSARAAREGSTDAMSALEDSLRTVSRKVGDVTPILDDTRAALDAAAKGVPASAAPAAAKPKTLADAEVVLAKAVSSSRAQAAASKSQFSKDIADEARSVSKKVDVGYIWGEAPVDFPLMLERSGGRRHGPEVPRGRAVKIWLESTSQSSDLGEVGAIGTA